MHDFSEFTHISPRDFRNWNGAISPSSPSSAPSDLDEKLSPRKRADESKRRENGMMAVPTLWSPCCGWLSKRIDGSRATWAYQACVPTGTHTTVSQGDADVGMPQLPEKRCVVIGAVMFCGSHPEMQRVR